MEMEKMFKRIINYVCTISPSFATWIMDRQVNKCFRAYPMSMKMQILQIEGSRMKLKKEVKESKQENMVNKENYDIKKQEMIKKYGDNVSKAAENYRTVLIDGKLNEHGLVYYTLEFVHAIIEDIPHSEIKRLIKTLTNICELYDL